MNNNFENASNLASDEKKNETNKKVGKAIGYSCIVLGILFSLMIFSTYSLIEKYEEEYDKQYVISDNGKLYYEIDGKRVYMEKIYDKTTGDVKNLKIPDKSAIRVYCDKININEGIYIDEMDNNTVGGMIFSCFVILFGVLVIPDKNTLLINILSFIWAFVVAVIAINSQVTIVTRYNELKEQNNIITATIFAEMLNHKGEFDLDNYKYLAQYTVEGKNYIYENDLFIEGKFENNYGRTVELYYDKDNPNVAVLTSNPIGGIITFLGIGLGMIGIFGLISTFKRKK